MIEASRARRPFGVAIARAIILDRVHGPAELDIVIVGIVEIAGDVAAGLAIAERRLAVVPHRTVVRDKACRFRLFGKSDHIFETVALEFECGVKETHPRWNADLALRIALFDQHQTFVVLAGAHIAAADSPARLERMRLFFAGSAVPQAGELLIPLRDRIASRYAELVPDVLLREAIFERIRREHYDSIETLLAVTDHRKLLEDNPLLDRSIRNRFPYLDPLNHIQIELLSFRPFDWRDRASDPAISCRADATTRAAQVHHFGQ